jgi:uncharacterized protein (TIGR02246 family)
MTRGLIGSCAFGLFILLTGCSDTPAPLPDTSAADQKTIKDGEQTWAKDWAAKDVDKILSHYSDDATLMIPETPVLRGREAMRPVLKQMLDDNNLALSFTPAEVVTSKSGDMGYTQGTYSMTMTNPKTKKAETETGKYVTVYKKQADGSWKAVEDINNSDAPAKAVASAARKAPAAKKRKK